MCRSLKLSKAIYNDTYGCVSPIDVDLVFAIGQGCDVLDTESQLIYVSNEKHEDLTPNVIMCRYL